MRQLAVQVPHVQQAPQVAALPGGQAIAAALWSRRDQLMRSIVLQRLRLEMAEWVFGVPS